MAIRLVTPPTASEEIKQSVVEKLEEILAQAKAGDITEFCMIIQHADPAEWSDISSMTKHIMTWVGRLEMTKLDWIAKYRENENE